MGQYISNKTYSVYFDHVDYKRNGNYKAPDHRAVVNKSKQRLSIVAFFYPNLSVDIRPAEKLIKSGSPPVYIQDPNKCRVFSELLQSEA